MLVSEVAGKIMNLHSTVTRKKRSEISVYIGSVIGNKTRCQSRCSSHALAPPPPLNALRRSVTEPNLGFSLYFAHVSPHLPSLPFSPSINPASSEPDWH